ncbi:putative uncharacterized protein [Firmicutes bacterium CAG:460]|nr:putative uncharacterized protein [Firmicutes bacterium CAG:460]
MKIKNINSNFKNLNSSKTMDDEICKIKFAYCHDKFPLEKLGPKELKTFINFCKKIEIMSWKEIKVDQGLNYETPKHFNVSIPDIFPCDATLVSFRASQKFRIIGWRESDNLNLMWFDKNHASYPG